MRRLYARVQPTQEEHKNMKRLKVCVVVTMLISFASASVTAPSGLGSSSLIRLLSKSPPEVIGAKQWTSTATELMDAASLLAEEASAFGDSSELDGTKKQALSAAVGTISALLDSAKNVAPELYAVAKLSAKRNGKLTSSRAAERCLVECGLLVGTYAALEAGEERAALLDAARPLSQTMPTAARLRALLVLCRGFHSPGFGSSSHGWRKGKGTVHQQLASAASSAAAAVRHEAGMSGGDASGAASAALEARLRGAPQHISRHSKLLRGSLPLIDAPLRLWLSNLKDRSAVDAAAAEAATKTATVAVGLAPPHEASGDDTACDGFPDRSTPTLPMLSTPECGAAALLWLLVDVAGEEGARLGQAIARWAVDTLYESIERPSSADAAPPPSVVARAHGSETARLLLITHAPLVKGSSRQQKRWMQSVDRVGHAVWLMLLAAREATCGANDEYMMPDGGCVEEQMQVQELERRRREQVAGAVLERVRAVMLACSLLERSDALRPRFRAAMSRAHTHPGWLWQLLGESLELDKLPRGGKAAPADATAAISDDDGGTCGGEGGGGGGDGGETSADSDLGSPSLATAFGGAEVASAAASLLSWSRPELVFKYLDLHSNGEGLSRDPAVAPLARRWLAAMLGLGGETVHALRCEAAENARHFEALAASGESGRRAVELWIESDRLGCEADVAARPSARATPVDDAMEGRGGGGGEGDDPLDGVLADGGHMLGSGVYGVCDPQSLFMLGEELRTCMRIDRQCVRENAALLGYVTQGHARVIAVSDADAQAVEAVEVAQRASDGEGDHDEKPPTRTAVRATARLLGRADTHAPVLFVDQPLFGHHLSTGDDPKADAERKARLEALLLRRAKALGAALGVPVTPWTECVAPPVDTAREEDDEDVDDEEVGEVVEVVGGGGRAARRAGRPSARAADAAWQGRVALVEVDGIAPQVYSNLRGRLVRGSLEAQGKLPPEEEEEGGEPGAARRRPRRGVEQSSLLKEERLVVHALVSVDLL